MVQKKLMIGGMWFWPISDEFPSFQNPMGFAEGWKEWPGSMRSGPSPEAEVYAREFIQNSWDRMQENFAKLRKDKVAIPKGAGIIFRFIELNGAAAANFVHRLGIDELRSRYAGLDAGDKGDVRLSETYLDAVKPTSIKLLLAVEVCGGGMPGLWKTGGLTELPQSKMHGALIGSFSSKEISASGGSYGHGKSGVVLGSKIRTLAAILASNRSLRNLKSARAFLECLSGRSTNLRS